MKTRKTRLTPEMREVALKAVKAGATVVYGHPTGK